MLLISSPPKKVFLCISPNFAPKMHHFVTVSNIHTGEGAGFRDRALLIYDGIHYDPLVMEGVGRAGGQRMFPVSDARILEKASQLAREAFQVSPSHFPPPLSLFVSLCFTSLCSIYSSYLFSLLVWWSRNNKEVFSLQGHA